MRLRSVNSVLLLLFLAATAPAQSPIIVYLAGDSTMARKLPEKRPETGWGEVLQDFFNPARVRIENHAQNGRSTRTFIEEKRWQAVVDNLKAGDYVFIQFGHNDASKDKVDRYTPPEDYRRNLIAFVEDVRRKKAIPVLMTPVMRRRFDREGNFYDSHRGYPDIVRSVAAANRVTLIDMHRKSERVIKQYGAEESRKLFLQLKPNESPNYLQGIEDNTHFSPLGASIMASLAVDGIREHKLALARHLKRANTGRKVKPDKTPSVSATWNLDNLGLIGGNPTNVIGDPQVIKTRAGKSILFDGLDDGIVIDKNPIVGASVFTIEAVFRPDAGGAREQRWFHIQEKTIDNRVLLEIRLDGDHWLLDTFIKSGENRRTLYAETFRHAVGEWYHVALVFDGSTMRHYVDGKEELSGPLIISPMGEGRTSIGVRMNRVHWFKGAIRKLRFTPRALAAREFMGKR
jgi:lysophospholipase L1-like esterase